MPRYEATITETVRHVELPAPTARAPEARSASWSGEAPDAEAAKPALDAAWAEKHGGSAMLAQAIVKITPLAS